MNNKLVQICFVILLITSQAELAAEITRLEFVFNQPEYAPGDTAYFTGFLIQGKNQVAGKQIVDIKLFGRDKELVNHIRVLFQNGIGVSQFIIPKNSTSGNYQFVCYLESSNLTKKPVFHSGYIAISGKNNLMTNDASASFRYDTSSIKVITDQEKYSRRSKVSVSLISELKNLKSSVASLSATVYNEKLFRDGNHKFISTVKTTNVTPERETVNESVSFPYFFMGNAFIKSSGKAVPDSSKITFYLNQSDFAFVVYTKPGGNFVFPLIRNFGNEEVFYRITYKGDPLSDSRILLYDAQPDSETIDSKTTEMHSEYGLYAKQKQIINESYLYFASKKNDRNSEDNSSDELEADDEILLDDFESFVSMEEVFTNIIPSVRFRKIGDVEKIQIFLQRTAKYGMNDPLYIVDGIMTDDTQYVLGLEPAMVNKIGVLRNLKTLSRFGDLGVDGILYIETNLPDSRKDISSENSLSVTGVSKAIEYKNLGYNQDNESVRTPDLRSSLYWNPRMDLESLQSFHFYTSDDVGYYIVQIMGIIDGQLYFSTKKFSVVAGSN